MKDGKREDGLWMMGLVGDNGYEIMGIRMGYG